MPDFATNKPYKRKHKNDEVRQSARSDAVERQILASGEVKRLPSSKNGPFSSIHRLLEDVYRKVKDLGGSVINKPLAALRNDVVIPGRIVDRVLAINTKPHVKIDPNTITKRMFVDPIKSNINGLSYGTLKANDVIKGVPEARRASIDIEEKNIRIPAAIIPEQVYRKSRRRKPQMIISGADREAYRQIFEPHKPGSAAHLPSAARLAQILRADVLLQKEGRSDNKISQMATAIREGRRREIADINPEHVQNIIHSALGGSHKAEQLLSSPSIHRMVERHNTLMNVVRAERTQHKETFIVPSGASQSSFKDIADIGDFRLPDRKFNSDPALLTDEKYHEAELLNMLANNEAQHINQVAGNEQANEVQESSRIPLTARARSRDRVLSGTGFNGSGSNKSNPMPFGLSEASPIPVMPFSSVTAPKGMAQEVMTKANQAAVQQNNGTSKKRQRLEGTLKMIGANGQVGGGAEISGVLS